jgi:hypothetical protein
MTTEEEIATLKELLAESHGVLRDMRHEMKDAKYLIGKLSQELVERRLKEEVEKGLETYRLELKEAMDRAVAHVTNEFDKLYDTLMGGEKRDRRLGNRTIPEIIETVAAAENARRKF